MPHNISFLHIIFEPSPQNWANSIEQARRHAYHTSTFWYRGGRNSFSFLWCVLVPRPQACFLSLLETKPVLAANHPWHPSARAEHKLLKGPCIHKDSPFSHLKETHLKCTQTVVSWGLHGPEVRYNADLRPSANKLLT